MLKTKLQQYFVTHILSVLFSVPTYLATQVSGKSNSHVP